MEQTTERMAALAPWRTTALLPLLLALLAFGLAFASPSRESEGSDPRGALLTAQLIIQQRSALLDGRKDLALALGYRATWQNGHVYYVYPAGTSLAAMPFVWAANQLGMDMLRDADERALQNLLSALSTAVVCLLAYRVCRQIVDPAPAALISASMVFGTALISTLGTALWSMNLATLLLLASLDLLLRPQAGDSIRRGLLIGALLAAAYVSRPTAALAALLLLLYCAVVRRRTAVGLALGGALSLALASRLALFLYADPVPAYYRAGFFAQPDPLLVAVGLLGNLLSPGRGLLVWSPQLLLLLVGLLALLPRLRREPLFWLALAWAGLHLLVISRFRNWWGGVSYGNRLYVDALPACLLLAALSWRAAVPRLTSSTRRITAAAFAGLSLVGVLIHSGQGLFSSAGLNWNYVDADQVDTYPAILFDWRFPPFLAGPDQYLRRRAAYLHDPPVPNELFGRPVWPLKDMLNRPVWRPKDVVLGPELSALLDVGWYLYEPDWDARWMQGVGGIWVASAQSGPALLRLTPAAVNMDGRAGDRGALAITLNGAPLWSGPIQVGLPIELPIALEQGINQLRLEVAGGAASLAPDDLRPLGVAFHTIEIARVGQ